MTPDHDTGIKRPLSRHDGGGHPVQRCPLDIANDLSRGGRLDRDGLAQRRGRARHR